MDGWWLTGLVIGSLFIFGVSRKTRNSARWMAFATAEAMAKQGRDILRSQLIAAAVVVALLTGCSSSDPIDSAETCAELDTAMHDASRGYTAVGAVSADWEKTYQEAQDAWTVEAVPRIEDRYSELSCSFEIHHILFDLPLYP